MLIFSSHFASGQDLASSSQQASDSDVAGRFGGRNEFGVWTGYSPFSFKFQGQSEDRQLFVLNLQYARKLIVNRIATFKYTSEIIPLALEVQPTQTYDYDGLLTNGAGTIAGAGASPIGFQGNFGAKWIQPFANGSIGFLYFNREVPIRYSSQFNFTVTVGFGAQFLQRSGHAFAVGWKYHHLSNADSGRLNPGIDSSMFYVGFSLSPRGHSRR